VLNATISRYAHALLEVRGKGDPMVFHSDDLDMQAHYAPSDRLEPDGRLDLLTATARRWLHSRDNGLQLSVRTDAPPGSGLGASSTIVVATVQAFADYAGRQLDPYELADSAYHIEREDLGISGGKQDQYAAAFGGFNFIEFAKGETVVTPLRIRAETRYELQSRLVMCHAGRTAEGAQIIADQKRRVADKDATTLAAMDSLKTTCLELKRHLLRGDVEAFGGCLNRAFEEKKRMSTMITTDRTQRIYQKAMEAGALGGKISGAGGGGFLFFITRPSTHGTVRRALADAGCEPIETTFEPTGAISWKSMDWPA